jgi:hypothetical protein
MKAYWGSGGIALHRSLLTSALDGGKWSATRSGRFTPKERAADIHCIGGWVDPRDGLDAVEGKGKVVSVLLTEHHAMKAYWGNECLAPLIL